MHDFGRKLAEKIGIVAQPGSTVNVGEVRIGRELSRQEYRNRQALLTKVKNFWVKGVLEKSLHEQVLICLGLQNRPDAVESPWNLMLGTENQPPQDLPPDTAIISIFDEIGEGRTLLILGEPGSGKTIALLQLARDLINRAEQNIEQRIPVVFNLSSWRSTIPAKKGRKTIAQTIAEWLVEELSSKYQVPRKIGEAWVKRQQLLLLLDGLDEVRAIERDACIAAINDFQQEFGTEIVVCCRVKDYEALQNRLNFQSAIYLRSLSAEQVQNYLNCLTADVAGLKTLLAEDFALQELAQSPLLLNIMVLAYQDVSVSDLPQINALAERQKQLFNDYINRMFEKTRSSAYTKNVPERLKIKLYSRSEATYWLICLAQQMRESQTIFLIENMQPTWLQTKAQKQWYQIMSFFIGALIGGLSSGLLGELNSTLNNKPSSKIGFGLSILMGLAGGLFVRLPSKIKLAEKLDWSWKEVKDTLINRLDHRLASTVFGGLLGALLMKMTIVLFFGLFSLLSFVVFYGLKTSEIETKLSPNQGIQSSIKNSIFVVLVIISSSILLSILGNLLFGLSFADLLSGGLRVGPLWGFVFGGAACIQHFTLRLILYRKGRIPWNYAKFLDYATERLFLQKVGGGYIFVHRLLMEHLAEMKRDN